MLVAHFKGQWLNCKQKEYTVYLSANDEVGILVEFYPNQQVCQAYYPDVESLLEDWEYIRYSKAS